MFSFYQHFTNVIYFFNLAPFTQISQKVSKCLKRSDRGKENKEISGAKNVECSAF